MQALINAYCHSKTINLSALVWHKACDTIEKLSMYPIFLPHYQNLIPQLTTILSSSENERAARYYFEKDKNRFIITRGWLKYILAQVTQLDVFDIELSYNAFGKPFLACAPELFFNISHACDYTIIAFSKTPIGLDIEEIKDDVEIDAVMKQVFTTEELESTLGSVGQPHNFYKYWTRKEALAKALGRGIDKNFKQLSCLDGDNKTISTEFNKIHDWQVMNFKLNEYIGALALADMGIIMEEIKVHYLPEKIY